MMKLIVEPGAGVTPVLKAIKESQKTIDILIFRLDREEIVQALEDAVKRGVVVRALTAYTNRGGEKSLRKLEMRLLGAGVTCSRSADDLVRYHGKMMIVDGCALHVYGFNFTAKDTDKSRSFGIITKKPKLISEAKRLFDADFDRVPYRPSYDRFIVSPYNSRQHLAAFLKSARQQLFIYDPHVSDDEMLGIIAARIKAGVDVRILGKVEPKWKIKSSEKFPGKRLHVRAIVCDGEAAFIGSQSLRKLELDKRREVGLIVKDKGVVAQIIEVFEGDWAKTEHGKKDAKREEKKNEAA